jgi:hypothetical protein
MLEGYKSATSKSVGAVMVKETVIYNHVVPGFKYEECDDDLCWMKTSHQGLFAGLVLT